MMPLLTAMLIGLVLIVAMAASFAEGIYRYRDANGQWIYTDRKPAADTPAESIIRKSEPIPPRIVIEQLRDEQEVALQAVNECLCTVEFGLRIDAMRGIGWSPQEEIRATLAPQSRRILLHAPIVDAKKINMEYRWTYVFGRPGAQHQPRQPYRLPFDIGRAYYVSQAYPSRITHVTPDSIYAVDFALPDQTPIYAAREGRIINIAHEHFRGGAKLSMMNEANFVEVLHDDDTVAMYAHLHWDSIRVRTGDRVQRGQYIANSGNTGFTTGPHLHFVVVRNTGLEAESVPVTFAGSAGEAVTPQTGIKLTAF